jgi:acyl-CoA reductase-like NAD-dependent aldehyde dehydrogenase
MEYSLFIGGARMPTTNHAEIKNPSTGEVVGLMPLATPEQLDQAVAAAESPSRAGARPRTRAVLKPAALSPKPFPATPRNWRHFSPSNRASR